MKIIFVSLVLLLTVILETSADDIPKPVDINMVWDNSAFMTNRTIKVGVLFGIKPGWHIYWKHPGDSGLPTEIKYTTQDELIVIENTLYPIPQIYTRNDTITDYGYENEVLLTNKLILKENFNKDAVNLKADINWVACKEICIPGNANFSLEINLSDKISEVNSDIFDKWENKFPSTVDQKNLPFSYKVDKLYDNTDVINSVSIKLNWQTVVRNVRIYPNLDRSLGIDRSDFAHNNKTSEYKFYPRIYGKDFNDIKELNVLISYVNSDNREIGIETMLKL